MLFRSCKALSISATRTGLLGDAAMPIQGAAATMLADASAAVRNSASRRVIGPVIWVLKIGLPAAQCYHCKLAPINRTTDGGPDRDRPRAPVLTMPTQIGAAMKSHRRWLAGSDGDCILTDVGDYRVFDRRFGARPGRHRPRFCRHLRNSL